MTNRDRSAREQNGDWAREVPWHGGRRGPYEDYGWERGESVLPEFRDPSVHEMPYDRQPAPREAGWRGGQQWFDTQRRPMMRNPYDYDSDYEHGRYAGGSRRDYDYDRDYEQNRWRSGGQGYGRMYNRDYDQGYRGGYERDYEQNRWRSGGQGYYGPDYDESNYGRDQDRWRGAYQNYGGMYNRDYERGRWGAGNRGYGGMYNRDYEQGRWGAGGQGYRGSSYDMPATWTYTEYWLIPGPFTGRGPRGYQRSDDRIKDDVCDRLTQHGQVDASDIDVRVENCEVTLSGMVNSREAKRMAEDVADSVQGVREVHNQLRVKQEEQPTQGQQGMQSRMIGQGQQSMHSQQTAQQREVGGSEGRS